MNYKLALSKSERAAIDWIGLRYAHGADLSDELFMADWELGDHADEMSDSLARALDGDIEWSGDYDIVFLIPEHIAWKIREIAEERDYQWDCFSSEFAAKLTRFVENIV